MSESVISNMLFRANHLRRLAKSLDDERTIHSLHMMAAEIEADVARLERDHSSPEASS